MGVAIRIEHLHHDYARSTDTATVHALVDLNLEIEAGAFVILRGASGSGKSTLLSILAGVEKPTSGVVAIDGADITRYDEKALTLLRRSSIGYIFQFFNLLPTLNVEENVAFPLSLSGVPAAEVRERVASVLGEVGLSHRARHSPDELSGGEMQRVAIARAIIHRPGLLLADEPTGNLDSRTGDQILELIRSIHASHRPTVVMATHSDHAATFGDYVLNVTDGRIQRA